MKGGNDHRTPRRLFAQEEAPDSGGGNEISILCYTMYRKGRKKVERKTAWSSGTGIAEEKYWKEITLASGPGTLCAVEKKVRKTWTGWETRILVTVWIAERLPPCLSRHFRRNSLARCSIQIQPHAGAIPRDDIIFFTHFTRYFLTAMSIWESTLRVNPGSISTPFGRREMAVTDWYGKLLRTNSEVWFGSSPFSRVGKKLKGGNPHFTRHD